uniref:DDE Tnp4 domain-containing protein n=1 Tax=Angiostrongylus cantonensis TaxID=6313 RepID=A0A158PCP4_ANGCA
MEVSNPEEVLAMLDSIDAMTDVLEYLYESQRRRRTYVRPEHVPFLETRFRDFDEYLSSQTPEAFLQYTRLMPAEFEQLFEHLGETHNAFPPITRKYLEEVAAKVQELYDYPRAVGFLDGRHVPIKKPNGGAEAYLNYKNFQSILLIAVCDVNHRFLIFDVGSPGQLGDASTFFDECDDVFPETCDLGDVGPVQYHILTDDGFGQDVRYIEPYPGNSADTGSKRRFNMKHGCARRVIDATFDILQRRFAVLQKPLQLEPNRATKLVTSLLGDARLLVISILQFFSSLFFSLCDRLIYVSLSMCILLGLEDGMDFENQSFAFELDIESSSYISEDRHRSSVL